MGKNFKDVRNVLNMKKIIATGIIAGTLFGGTSAFAAGGVDQNQSSERNVIQKDNALWIAIFQNQTADDFLLHYKVLITQKNLAKPKSRHF